MALDGQWDFTPPAWVGLVQLARWAGVPAWDLERAPTYWVERYAAVREAEDHAAEMRRRQQPGR